MTTVVLAIAAGVLADAAMARRGAAAHDAGEGRWLPYSDVQLAGPQAAGATFDRFLPGYTTARRGRGYTRVRGFEPVDGTPGNGETATVRAVDVLAVGWPLSSYRARRSEELTADHWAISSAALPAFGAAERTWQPAWAGLITNVVLYSFAAAALAGLSSRVLQPATGPEPLPGWRRATA